MELAGLRGGAPRAPLLPLAPEARESLRGLLERAQAAA
jgi:dihydrodipicolinate synthase/N-acetylneuraminate lyase